MEKAIMARKLLATKFNVALIGANILFLVWFWWYFFAHASQYQAGHPSWEQAAPWAVVLNRGFGNSLSMLELKAVPIFQISFVVYFPCFVVTWPLGRFFPPEFYMLGTNPQGLRLIMVTVLSFIQWALLVKIYTTLLRMLNLRKNTARK
jgi:hypothetical protein